MKFVCRQFAVSTEKKPAEMLSFSRTFTRLHLTCVYWLHYKHRQNNYIDFANWQITDSHRLWVSYSFSTVFWACNRIPRANITCTLSTRRDTIRHRAHQECAKIKKKDIFSANIIRGRFVKLRIVHHPSCFCERVLRSFYFFKIYYLFIFRHYY